MQPSWQEFWIKFAIMLVPIFGTALTVLVGLLSMWAKARLTNEKIAGAADRMSWSVVTLVKGMAQTLVEDLKSKSSDGKLTDDEVASIKEKLWSRFKAYWGESGLEELKKSFGYESDVDLRGAVQHEAEAVIYDLKRDGVEPEAPVGDEP